MDGSWLTYRTFHHLQRGLVQCSVSRHVDGGCGWRAVVMAGTGRRGCSRSWLSWQYVLDLAGGVPDATYRGDGLGVDAGDGDGGSGDEDGGVAG